MAGCGTIVVYVSWKNVTKSQKCLQNISEKNCRLSSKNFSDFVVNKRMWFIRLNLNHECAYTFQHTPEALNSCIARSCLILL